MHSRALLLAAVAVAALLLPPATASGETLITLTQSGTLYTANGSTVANDIDILSDLDDFIFADPDGVTVFGADAIAACSPDSGGQILLQLAAASPGSTCSCSAATTRWTR